METTCTDDAMFYDEFLLDDKASANVDMEDKAVLKQQTFATLSPMRKIEHLDDCDVADVFLSPSSTDQNIVTQANSPAEDSDFASDSSDDENGRFVTRVMRKVPSKMHQRVDTAAIEENAR